MVSIYEQEKDLRMSPGDTYALGGFTYRFVGVEQLEVANYITFMGTVDILRNERKITTVYPEKRLYPIQSEPMTEAGISPGIVRDFYVSLGEPLDDSGAWSVRIHIKPFVRWIWLGAIFMALGALIAATDQRLRSTVKSRVALNPDSATSQA